MAKNLSLNTNRRVVAVDLRNHGDSPHVPSNTYLDMAADLKALMSELNVENDKASFIGHSLGGRTAMTLVLMNPELGRDLVVVDISPVGELPHITSYFGIYNSLKALRIDHSQTLAEMRKKAFEDLGKDIKNEGLRKFLLSNLVKDKDKFRWRVNLDGLANEYENLLDMPQFGSTFDKPTLFLCGERSDYVPHDHHKGIYKLFPKARIEYFQDTGHLPHAERPDQFLRVVSEFFNKTYTVK
uniref:sn-1-specific diacylglycerol lipase ABHD11 n=1 Tax=Lygus hesperus TaxID=30085 RepID=A0A0A9Y497_LYGHE